MISEKNSKKRIQEGIFRNYWMNYLTEFDMYIDIVLLVYMFFAMIFFFFLKVDVRR